MVCALRGRGFRDVVFFGLPDTWEMLRWMRWRGVQVLAKHTALRVLRKIGLYHASDSKFTEVVGLLERLAIKKIDEGGTCVVYTTKTFLSLIKHCAAVGIPSIVEIPTQPAKTDLSVAAQLATRAIVFAEDDKAVLITQRVPAERVCVVTLVDPSVLPPKPAASCPEVPRFIYTAFFKKRKKLEIVLRAWTLRRSNEGELHIVGPLKETLKHLRSIYAHRRDIVFWGFRDPEELYKSIQGVGLMVSEREGLPRAMLEYMQHGFPILVSEEASKGFVKDGVTGCVLDPCNEETLRNAFDSILDDYLGFWVLGVAGKKYLYEEMEKSNFAKQVVEIIREVATDFQSSAERPLIDGEFE